MCVCVCMRFELWHSNKNSPANDLLYAAPHFKIMMWRQKQVCLCFSLPLSIALSHSCSVLERWREAQNNNKRRRLFLRARCLFTFNDNITCSMATKTHNKKASGVERNLKQQNWENFLPKLYERRLKKIGRTHAVIFFFVHFILWWT